jgi:hypothetical protein
VPRLFSASALVFDENAALFQAASAATGFSSPATISAATPFSNPLRFIVVT